MPNAETRYRDILRRDLYAFAERSFAETNPHTQFLPNWHIELIAASLEAVRLGTLKRLIINEPPRSLKSFLASTAFPAWLLGHNPSAQILAVSYAQDLADKLARDCRALMASPFYQALFPTRLSPQKQATAEYETTAKGFRLSTSIGGVLTGRGADYIIIDDALKPDEALSDVCRKAANDWYDGTLYSRLNDKARGAIVIIMQRLHEDDLVGHVLEQEPWTVISLSAIAERDEDYAIETPYGQRRFRRRCGQPLHAERESLETLERIRQTIGSYNFAAQYQQRPAPYGGGIIKAEWFRTYEPPQLPTKFDRIIQSWDTANKATELSDYSVCTTWGLKDTHIYLLDVLRQRLNYPELKRAVRAQGQRFGAAVILVEDAASGTQLIQELAAEGLPAVTKSEPEHDKVMRMHAQTAMIENGLVFLPKAAPWLVDYIHELSTFPKGKHDDQVNSTSQALGWIKQSSQCSVQGWLDYYRALAEKAHGITRTILVRVKAPPGLTLFYVGAGPLRMVGPDGTAELSEEDARTMIKNGWTRVDPH